MENTNYDFCTLIFLSFVLCQSMNSSFVLSQSRVNSLPGFNGSLPFSLETGYIGIELDELQIFYYFFESENNPKQDPLILWLTGGPHCSGMSAILYEIGPFQLKEMTDTETLPEILLRKHSWTKIASIIFIDLPVGTGFSYATTTRANYSGDLRASYNVDEFLRKWLVKHPKYGRNPIYLGGDSYSGFTLPVYFDRLARGNEEGMKPFLNLKGYLLGNPATDRSIDGNTQISFAHGMGLISDELFESLQKSCKGEYHHVHSHNRKCRLNILRFERDLIGIQITNILEDYCDVDYIQGHKSFNRKRIMSENMANLYHAKQLGAFSCRKEGYKLALYWMNDKHVQKALHVRKEKSKRWIRCNYGFKYSYDIASSVTYHAELSAKGFRSLIYSFLVDVLTSGDHDMIVPYIGTQKWIKSLNYSISDDWRKWIVDGQIAGYTRTYTNNMTFATIKGGGHTAPEYKPKQCVAMFKRWIVGHPL